LNVGRDRLWRVEDRSDTIQPRLEFTILFSEGVSLSTIAVTIIGHVNQPLVEIGNVTILLVNVTPSILKVSLRNPVVARLVLVLRIEFNHSIVTLNDGIPQRLRDAKLNVQPLLGILKLSLDSADMLTSIVKVAAKLVVVLLKRSNTLSQALDLLSQAFNLLSLSGKGSYVVDHLLNVLTKLPHDSLRCLIHNL